MKRIGAAVPLRAAAPPRCLKSVPLWCILYTKYHKEVHKWQLQQDSRRSS